MSASLANMNVDQLLAERSKIDAAIKNLGASAEGSTKKEKKGKKKGGPAGPWAAWTTHCTKVAYTAEIAAFKEAAESKLGAHLKWISANAGKDSAEYKAFAAQFALDHPKGSGASAKASVVSDEEEVASCVSDSGSGDDAKDAKDAKDAAAPKKRGAKKLADMTVEEKAAHDAKVAAKRAAKAAAKAEAAPAPEAAPVVSAAPAADASVNAEPVAAAEADASVNADEPAAEWLQFELDGTKYFRLGVKNADGSVVYEPDLWRFNKKTGARGSYVGALLDDGSIDADAEEPNLA